VTASRATRLRTALRWAPRPWVIVLAVGLGLLAISLVHAERTREAASRAAAGHSSSQGERSAPQELRGIELAPPSRPALFEGAAPVVVLSAALPPATEDLEGCERGTSLAPGLDRRPGQRLGPSTPARGPPPSHPA
jgi:hypothetical protein